MTAVYLNQAAISILGRSDFSARLSGNDEFSIHFANDDPSPNSSVMESIISLAGELEVKANIEQAKREIAGYVDAVAEKITNIRPENEVRGWVSKQKASVEYLAARAANNDVATSKSLADPIGRVLIDAEISVTGEEWDAIANKILASAQGFAYASGKFAGVSRKYMKQLDELTPITEEGVQTIITNARADTDAILVEIIQLLGG